MKQILYFLVLLIALSVSSCSSKKVGKAGGGAGGGAPKESAEPVRGEPIPGTDIYLEQEPEEPKKK